MATQDANHALEEQALREHGILGRSGPYGNALYAFDYALLPPEGKQVLEEIAAGAPLRHPEHDGRFYGNRSLDLPGTGEFREFTVPTPGLTHRGRRRFVIRGNGMVFFTACHYDRVPGQVGSPQHQAAIEGRDEQWRNGFYVVTGIEPALRARIQAAMQRIHDSRLPVLVR
jgi:ribonuclease T1